MPSELTEPTAVSIERVVVQGDLSRLTADDRVAYYRAVCESVGLNPLTKPFDYITLNGKVVLYAKKDCTDQLRSIHKVSVQIVSRELVGEDVYAVTARAMKPDGRCDESIGAVTVAGLKGESKANAIMKCETKAKRRVTLSICGLGMLDETEVETIPNAEFVDFPQGSKRKPLELPPPDEIIPDVPDGGSREAQRAVADRKIAELEAQAKARAAAQPQAEAPKPGPQAVPAQSGEVIPPAVLELWKRMGASMGSWIPVLEELKVQLIAEMGEVGETEYYEILLKFSVEHANQIRKPQVARQCAHALWTAWRAAVARRRESEITDDDLPSNIAGKQSPLFGQAAPTKSERYPD